MILMRLLTILVLMATAACGASASLQPPASPQSAPSPTTELTETAEASEAAHQPVVPAPMGILPPSSVARVTVDGLRVRAGPPDWAGFPDLPQPDEVIHTLSAGDLVLIGPSPLSYHPPETSPDGRGWYEVQVGGRISTTLVDGGIIGWVAEGESGLEYLSAAPLTCPGTATLEALLYLSGEGGAGDELTTGWDRLACHGGEQLEVEGVHEYWCYEGGVYPYEFRPAFIAYPGAGCAGLILDDIDADGHGRAGALPLHFRDGFAAYPERGDVIRVRGHFDDPVSSSCSADTPPGFDGVAIDPEFLILFCREQFVVDEVTVIGHRDLAPLPWEPH